MWLWYIFFACRLLQGIFASTFNMVTIICVFKFTYLRSPSNILVAGLAFTDFFHGLGILIPFTMRTFYNVWPAFKYFCLSSIGFDIVLAQAQWFIFSLLSIERYFALKAQLGQGKSWTIFRAVILVLSGWIFFLTITITAAIFSTGEEGDPCYLVHYYHLIFRRICLTEFIITTFLTVTFYAKIAKITLGSRNQVMSNNVNAAEAQQRKAVLRVTKMFAMVVGVYFSLYIPLISALFISNYIQPTPLHYGFINTFVLFKDSNFWINPFIYAWRNKDFRKAYKTLLKW